jgi:hypothetical protein
VAAMRCNSASSRLLYERGAASSAAAAAAIAFCAATVRARQRRHMHDCQRPLHTSGTSAVLMNNFMAGNDATVSFRFMMGRRTRSRLQALDSRTIPERQREAHGLDH